MINEHDSSSIMEKNAMNTINAPNLNMENSTMNANTNTPNLNMENSTMNANTNTTNLNMENNTMNATATTTKEKNNMKKNNMNSDADIVVDEATAFRIKGKNSLEVNPGYFASKIAKKYGLVFFRANGWFEWTKEG